LSVQPEPSGPTESFDREGVAYRVVRSATDPRADALVQAGTVPRLVTASRAEDPRTRRTGLAAAILRCEDPLDIYGASPRTRELLALPLADHLGPRLEPGGAAVHEAEIRQWFDPAARQVLTDAFAGGEGRARLPATVAAQVRREFEGRYSETKRRWRDRGSHGWSGLLHEEAMWLLAVGEETSSPRRDAYIRRVEPEVGPFEAARAWDLFIEPLARLAGEPGRMSETALDALTGRTPDADEWSGGPAERPAGEELATGQGEPRC
jgi:hypothetical protein